MPELPEVETIKIGLQKNVVGLKIKKIQVLNAKTFIGNPKLIRGKKVLRVWRRSKVLGIDLSGNLCLLFHLKMTGQLIWINSKLVANDRLVGGHPTLDMKDNMPSKHTRAYLTFNNDSQLFFNDQRKFGWIKVIETKELKLENSLKDLGPEPLEKDFTWQILKNNLLKRKNALIKVVLMDNSVICGVGNIYASEACFNAKIDPQTRVVNLTDLQVKKLHLGIIKSLQDGIKYGGATRAHFVDSNGRKGYFLDYAYVYGKDKHPCKVCKTEIKKIQLAGRGTYWCSKCQK